MPVSSLFKTPVIAAIVCVGIAMPASAETFRYLCEMPPDQSGYITATYVLDVDTSAKTVKIQDALTNAIEGEPVDGEIAEFTDRKHVFKWELILRSSNGQNVKMRYRAAVFRNNMTARVEATPIGYSNRFQQRGGCRVVS